MMSTRRSLFTLGVLLAAMGLLAPEAVAQTQSVGMLTAAMVEDTHTKLKLTWVYTHDNVDDPAEVDGLGFYVYHVKGKDPGALNSIPEINAAMRTDAMLPTGTNRVVTATSTTFTYELAGLTGDTDYVVNVLSYSGLGVGKTVNTGPANTPALPEAKTAKTDKAPPPADVRNVKVESGDEMLTVSWDRPPHTGASDLTISEYKVRYRVAQTLTEDEGPWIPYPAATVTTKLTATKAELKSLLNGVVYDVQVRAVNSGGADGEWAPEVAAKGTPSADAMPMEEEDEEEEEEESTTTPTTTDDGEEVRAGEPSKVVLTKNTATAGDKSLTVAWLEPGSGTSPLLGFQVKAMMSDGTGAPTVEDVGAAIRTATVTGLTNAKKYMVMVRARNSVDYGPWSDAVEGTPAAKAAAAGAPVKMSEPMVEAGDKMLMVSWIEPASDRSIAHYDVRYKTASATTWEPDPKKPMTVTAMMTEIKGLVNGTVYLVQVRAVDSAGNAGPWSDSGSGTPMMPTPALPVFGAIALAGALAAAGRRRVRQRQLRSAKLRYLPKR